MAQYAVRVQWRGMKELMKVLSPETARKGINEGLTDAAFDVQHRAKDEVPRKTGRLATSIRVWGRQSGPTRRIVAGGGNVRYAAPVHEGAKPHTIRPKNKKFLFFPSQQITSDRFGARAKLKFRKSGRLSARSMKRYGNAAYVLTKLVHHPGNPPNKFMERALLASPIKEIIGRALVRAWKAAA